jgi:outer membrane lipoprotein-sorting protein
VKKEGSEAVKKEGSEEVKTRMVLSAGTGLRACAIAFGLLLLAAGTVAAQPAPTAGEVLRRVRAEFEKVRDYTADIAATVDVPGIKAPPMKAKLYFKKPDKVHLESTSFAMLPRDAVAYNPSAFSEDMFDAVLQGEEMVGGVKCLKVKLLAKSDTIRLQRVTLFVDPARWLVLKMTTDPSQGGSADILLTYAFIDNAHFLPATIVLTMANPSAPRRQGMKQQAAPTAPASPSDAEKRKATVRLVYSNHRVNKGIPDSIFHKDGKNK